MKLLELWRWRLRDHRGKVIETRYRLTEAEALQRDPDAVRVPDTREAREVPETNMELAQSMPGTTIRSGLVPRRGWWRQPAGVTWSAARS